MRYAFEALLRLYPAPYRLVFGREMAGVFVQATGDYQARGVLTYSMFLCAEFGGLIAGAFTAWTDEYMLRSRRRLTTPFVISVIAGAAVTAFFQWFAYIGLARRRFIPNPPAEALQTHPQIMGLLVLIGICIILISVLSLAFVWNMRTIGNRAGRLKPIWMPGNAVDGRSARRERTLRRSSGRERREFQRRIR